MLDVAESSCMDEEQVVGHDGKQVMGTSRGYYFQVSDVLVKITKLELPR